MPQKVDKQQSPGKAGGFRNMSGSKRLSGFADAVAKFHHYDEAANYGQKLLYSNRSTSGSVPKGSLKYQTIAVPRQSREIFRI
ncbi:MAG: hypothetical protein ACU837_00955 [Gammaproteobacteria bacterium]